MSCTHLIPIVITPILSCPDVIHKFVRDLYSKRFPELESLVHTALEYVRTVQVSVCRREGMAINRMQCSSISTDGWAKVGVCEHA